MVYKKAFVVAEAGCNHKGDMDIAHEMIRVAASFCKADAIKFQKRCNRELLTPEQYNAPHPNPANAYGKTYGEHREFLEFTAEQHEQLKHWCEEEGIIYATSVWDLTSAKEIAALKPRFIKVPSASNTHWEMLQWLCEHYDGEIHLSLGMTDIEEEKQIVQMFKDCGRAGDLVLYSCTSGYPVKFEEICLLEISRIRSAYGDCIKGVGFSGHHLGITADIAAYTLGAAYLERHFTLDRTWKGTDQAASLEPNEVRDLICELDQIRSALTFKSEPILPVEQVQRKKLKYRER